MQGCAGVRHEDATLDDDDCDDDDNNNTTMAMMTIMIMSETLVCWLLWIPTVRAWGSAIHRQIIDGLLL